MKAAYIEKYGREIVYGDRPEPACGADDVLVEVRAASINPIDWKTRSGQLKPLLRYRLPQILGGDVSGVVIETGAGVRRFSVGDEVFGRVDKRRVGTFAERVAVRADELAQKPKSLTHGQAAAVPLVTLTAWQALFDKADLQTEQRVLIHAGSGGVGTVAIQLARHAGAHVTTTASGRHRELLEQLGAHEVIDYRSQDFTQVAAEQDVVFDTIGGHVQKRSWRVIKKGGVLVTVAGAPTYGEARHAGAALPVSLMLGLANAPKRLGSWMRNQRYEYLMMRSSGAQLEEIAALIDAGHLRPVIDSEFPLADIEKAFARSESGRAQGKIVVTVP